MSELSQRLAELLDASVAKCTEGQDVAVAFSGGIDSSLVAALAKRHANSVRLYTVGTGGSHDVEAAREVAPLLGLELTVIDLPDGDIVENLREMISATGTESPLTLAFEMPLFCVMRNCPEGTVLGGQGADELFAGYNKYVGMKDLQMRDEMAKDLAKLYTATKPHEAAMGRHFGKTMKYAYLDKDIVALSRNAPTEALRPIDEDVRKKLLSDAACDLGFGFLADRKKKAAQYGSGMMDAVRRVCKSKGCTYNELVAELVRSVKK
ncbi:MAG: asparagine synthase [Candidatus Methanomethylophilus sp.]|nr:asparagine synthase [Methanomethylophilus sp.]